ncbi:hypothetical protein EB796_019169 [Bugula neritina]|uniref:Uncharacterized protein n=1 Tax=Bugula neritina TaxID=10212 RepID=A0A7J7J9X5_BUGNE|nr:hypothetical protein EB796_019169 [Bugula neritina]
MSSVILQIQPEYGYVLLVFILSIIQLYWMMVNVIRARNKYDVKVCQIHSQNKTQSVNVNVKPKLTLPVSHSPPAFILRRVTCSTVSKEFIKIRWKIIPVSGSHFPWRTETPLILYRCHLSASHLSVSAGAGLVIILGRVFYALGYYTGDPSKRRRGGFMILGKLVLFGCVISTALSLLGYI